MLGIKGDKSLRTKASMEVRNAKRTFDDYKVHPAQFMDVKTPICAYVLGLLWSDGCVRLPRMVSFATTYPDGDYFVPLFMKTGNWNHYRHTHKNQPTWKEMCILTTSNKDLTYFLIDNDYLVKGTHSADKILSKIPDNLKHFWIRGLVDGDGTIRSKDGCYQLSVASAYNQNWDYLTNVCNKLSVQSRVYEEENIKQQRNSKFVICGQSNVLTFCNFMYNGYPDDDLGLKRKYDKFLELKARSEKK